MDMESHGQRSLAGNSTWAVGHNLVTKHDHLLKKYLKEKLNSLDHISQSYYFSF